MSDSAMLMSQPLGDGTDWDTGRWVQDECDPAYALLCDSVNKVNVTVRIGAIMGLGLAYAGERSLLSLKAMCPRTRWLGES